MCSLECEHAFALSRISVCASLVNVLGFATCVTDVLCEDVVSCRTVAGLVKHPSPAASAHHLRAAGFVVLS